MYITSDFRTCRRLLRSSVSCFHTICRIVVSLIKNNLHTYNMLPISTEEIRFHEVSRARKKLKRHMMSYFKAKVPRPVPE